MKPFSYTSPATLGEALGLLARGTRPIAGGTDLIPLMNDDVVAPDGLIGVGGLLPQGVQAQDDAVRIGAGTSLADLERDPLIASRYAALSQAAASAASAQLRNMATLGGNLLQRPRCWYFRHPQFHCWLKGGDACPARDGENRLHALFGADPCVAVHPSDPAPALLAFDAKARVLSAGGERLQALESLFALPEAGRRRETTLGEDELLLGLELPLAPAARSVYLKAMDRGAFAFALAAVAVVLRRSSGGRIEHVRIVLGGVAPMPWRAGRAETLLLGAEPTDELLEEAADAALEGARPLRHNGWKLPLCRTLVLRALRQTCE